MKYDFAMIGFPEKLKTFWGEKEQRNKQTFRVCTESKRYEVCDDEAKRLRGEIPGGYIKKISDRTANFIYNHF